MCRFGLLAILLGVSFWNCVVTSMQSANEQTAQENVRMETVLTRLNFGTIFRMVTETHLISDRWWHSFIIKLPQLGANGRRDKSHVQNTANHCSEIRVHFDKLTCLSQRSLLLTIQSFQETIAENIDSLIRDIYHMIPDASIKISLVRGQQHRRSLLPFIGSGLQSLFGTATMDDIKHAEAHIADVESRLTSLTAPLAHEAQKLTSSIIVTNQRLDNLNEQMQRQGKTIGQLFNFTNTVRESNDAMLVYLEMIANATTDFIKIHDQISEVLSAVHSLAQGTLSPYLVDPATMRHVLNGIARTLQNHHPGSKLAYSEPDEIYRLKDFVYKRTGVNLHLAVAFPITFTMDKARIYEIETLPLLIPNNIVYSEVAGLPKALMTITGVQAALDDRTAHHAYSHYALLNRIPEVNNNDLLNVADIDSALVNRDRVSKTDCAVALFDNEVESIMSACTFTARTVSLTSSARLLNKSRFYWKIYKILR